MQFRNKVARGLRFAKPSVGASCMRLNVFCDMRLTGFHLCDDYSCAVQGVLAA